MLNRQGTQLLETLIAYGNSICHASKYGVHNSIKGTSKTMLRDREDERQTDTETDGERDRERDRQIKHKKNILKDENKNTKLMMMIMMMVKPVDTEQRWSFKGSA